MQPEETGAFFAKAGGMFGNELKTTIHKRFGLHAIKDAIETYKANQSAGKILLQSELTDISSGQEIQLDQSSY